MKKSTRGNIIFIIIAIISTTVYTIISKWINLKNYFELMGLLKEFVLSILMLVGIINITTKLVIFICKKFGILGSEQNNRS